MAQILPDSYHVCEEASDRSMEGILSEGLKQGLVGTHVTCINISQDDI